MDEYEIVFVDDQSDDNTLATMQEMAKMYSNVQVVALKEHRFLGGARNAGMDAAQGRYIWFVDADDLIAEDGCHATLHKAIDENLDLVGFEYCLVDNEGNWIKNEKSFVDYTTRDGVSFAKCAFDGRLSNHLGYVVRFLYRREFLMEHQIRFPEGVRWEDTVFMPNAIIEADRIGAIEKVLYMYRQNPSSISGTMRRQYPAQLIYEFSFVTGLELLKYAKRVTDEQLSNELYQTACKRYINGFVLFLLRTTLAERTQFYKLIKQHSSIVEELKPYMNRMSKMIVIPGVGRIAVELLSLTYNITH